MFVVKKLVFFSIIVLISNCALNNNDNSKNTNSYSINIKTPNDKYNIYFKENLNRFFRTNDNEKNYILETNITFETTNTLSVSGQNILKSTKGKINYQLRKNTKIVKSGSINTFPALSSSSTSLYTQEKSIEHIRDRLIKSSAKSLYMHILIIMRSLS